MKKKILGKSTNVSLHFTTNEVGPVVQLLKAISYQTIICHSKKVHQI